MKGFECNNVKVKKDFQVWFVCLIFWSLFKLTTQKVLDFCFL